MLPKALMDLITSIQTNSKHIDQTHFQIITSNFLSRKLAHSYSISQELKELVKHNFKSEEEIRFSKQQFVSWVAIGVSLLLGILGVIF